MALIVLLLAATGAAAAPNHPDTLPGLGQGERRVPVDGTAPPWRAVARLQAPGLVRCTAVVIAPDRAITAAHCLWSHRLNGWIPPSALHVLAGYRSGGFTHHQRVTGYTPAPGFDPARPNDTSGVDVAVLRLLGAGPAPLGLATGALQSATPVMLGGYNQDFNEVILADPACAITGMTQDHTGHPLLIHTCAGTRGTSGAPLLVAAEGGWRIAGIQAGALKGSAGGTAAPGEVIARLLGSP